MKTEKNHPSVNYFICDVRLHLTLMQINFNIHQINDRDFKLVKLVN